MWLLECDGDLFGHKRLWLRPGKSYLFGRTKAPAGETSPHERSFAIANRSVSRKHLVIAIGPVHPGEGTQVYAKSQVTLRDDSKIGTTLDGEKFVKQERKLTGKEHIIKLGSYEQNFKITWHQVCFSFSFTDKQIRTAKDALAPAKERFENLDIKTTIAYVIDCTTHVISSKRNIAKGLQALINGKHIVTDAFLDAVEAAAASPGFEDDGITPLASPLEDDFDANWPNALDFLPGPGKEPHPRSAALFAPDPQRIKIFEGFTFIFADDSQYENLAPALQNGTSKCLKYDLVLGQTKLQDFVSYVMSVAGRKGTGRFDSGNEGVTVVRFRGKGDTAQWALDFIRDLDRELGQRSTEQNEFLDAILLNDTSGLRRPLPEEDVEDGSAALPSTAVSAAPVPQPPRSRRRPSSTPQPDLQIKEAPSSVQKEGFANPSQSKRKIRRTATKSRFKGFDDFDDENFEPKPIPSSPMAAIEEEDGAAVDLGAAHNQIVDSESLFVGGSQDAQHLNSADKKRKAPSEQGHTEELFPAVAAMKKRRLAEGSSAANDLHLIHESTAASKQQKTGKKKRPELDVRSAARSHATDIDRVKHDPSQPTDVDEGARFDPDEDISALRNLVIVEEMEVKPRTDRVAESQRSRGRGHSTQAPAADDAEEQEDTRWLPEWNGRKNFKKFRRQGAEGGVNRGSGNRVIVRLEEAKKRDFGAHDYFLEDSNVRATQSQRPSSSSTTARTKSHSLQATSQRPVHTTNDDSEDESILPEEVAGTARDATIVEKVRETQERRSGPSQTTNKGKGRGKRPAASEESPPAAKRTRQTRIAPAITVPDDESSEEEDPMKFKFRRRG